MYTSWPRTRDNGFNQSQFDKESSLTFSLCRRRLQCSQAEKQLQHGRHPCPREPRRSHCPRPARFRGARRGCRDPTRARQGHRGTRWRTGPCIILQQKWMTSTSPCGRDQFPRWRGERLVGPHPGRRRRVARALTAFANAQVSRRSQAASGFGAPSQPCAIASA